MNACCDQAGATCFLRTWGEYGSDPGEFQQVRGVAVAANGTVYTVEQGTDRVQVFNAAGTFLDTWGQQGHFPGEFVNPNAVAVAPAGSPAAGVVYVADTKIHRIRAFGASGSSFKDWGEKGSDPGKFDLPNGVEVAPNGAVYVTDTINNRVQYFSATGDYQGEWGVGVGFNQPIGIAVAPNGTVYVSDLNSPILLFGPTGTPKGELGKQGSKDGEFSGGWMGVAVAPDGTVFVTDVGNRRVQAFDPSGSFLGEWGRRGKGLGEFEYPGGIAVAPDGTVYVADSREDTDNNRVQAFCVNLP